MAAIRGKDTKPEMVIRRRLHARGFRFRLHVRTIPGTPDIVLRRHGAIIDIRSCFFHGHNCSLFKMPSTRREFWAGKIEENRRRDARCLAAQMESGWRVAIVWECALRGPGREDADSVIDTLSDWLFSDEKFSEVRGSG